MDSGFPEPPLPSATHVRWRRSDVPDAVISLLALCPRLVKLTDKSRVASATPVQVAQIEKMKLGIQVLECGCTPLFQLAEI
ncbi:hypothetical protein BV25DRAFT_1919785 [Artomyces pyxidatus]|uniref:Uncharacterized protein n=1 Tax=Artomyces pyxidatus TaxID=48021 RepID=A0ACB8SQ09_9AGAM|nr:hypothetical protein BV25DRAFT_1919785 [Artomyces pyxidatus]